MSNIVGRWFCWLALVDSMIWVPYLRDLLLIILVHAYTGVCCLILPLFPLAYVVVEHHTHTHTIMCLYVCMFIFQYCACWYNVSHQIVDIVCLCFPFMFVLFLCILLLLWVVTFMQHIYNYISETSHVSRSHIVAAILQLQFMVNVISHFECFVVTVLLCKVRV
jgi:hypothetical protein